jgi:hypothetical protein
MGHRQHWETSIYTGERANNSPYAQPTGGQVGTYMHKQRNWEKGLEGHRNGRKHGETSREAELQDMEGLGFDRARRGTDTTLTQHGHDMGMTLA